VSARHHDLEHRARIRLKPAFEELLGPLFGSGDAAYALSFAFAFSM
jgi:hypothetical protein